MNHRVQMKTPIGVLTIESNEKAVTLIALPHEAGEHTLAANGCAIGGGDDWPR